MNWNRLQEHAQLNEICKLSEAEPVLIYKHSTRCATSALVLNRLERNWNPEEMAPVKPYLLDLLTFRELSDAVSHLFGIRHESPQVLLIEKGKVIYETSHHSIDYHVLKDVINRTKQTI